VSFKDQPGKDFFAAGPRRSQFRDVTEQLKASYKAVKSQRDKQWKKEYNAQKLALLVFLIRREELERKPAVVAASVATRGAKKKGGKNQLKMTDLCCAVIKFKKVYEHCLALPTTSSLLRPRPAKSSVHHRLTTRRQVPACMIQFPSSLVRHLHLNALVVVTSIPWHWYDKVT